MIEVNGKTYPLWDQFIERQAEWIGGVLEELCPDPMATEITSIELRANGSDSAFFEIRGKDFSCGFDVRYGGIAGKASEKPWLLFSGYGDHQFRIKQNPAALIIAEAMKP